MDMMIERMETVGPMVTDTPGASAIDVSFFAQGAFGMSKHQAVSQKSRMHKLLVGCLQGVIGTALLYDLPSVSGQERAGAPGETSVPPSRSNPAGAPIAGDLSASPWSSRLSSPPPATVRWGMLQPIDEPRRAIPTRTVSNSEPMASETSRDKPSRVTIANPWVFPEQPEGMSTEDLFPFTSAMAPESGGWEGSPREHLAKRVSENILETDRTRPAPPPEALPPQPLERPVGWNALEGELRTSLEKCDQLLRRGAVHSARDEVVLGLRKLMRTMDAIRGSFVSEPALDKGIQALKEELDFLDVNHGLTVDSIVATHSTLALKNRSLAGVSPAVASQHYRSYARYQLLLAADEHPWSADLLYALGKTFEKEAEGNTVASTSFRSQAVICYQAAIQIKSNHPEASNQLGYSLLLLDRVDEALVALNHAVQLNPSASSWANLAEAYRRSGATEQASVAVAKAGEWQRAERPGYSRTNPEVVEISPEEFARFSPAQNSYSPGGNSAAAQSNRSSPPVRSAGPFSNLFR